MPTTKPTNQMAKPERMVCVLEKRVRLQGAVPCKVAESGASARSPAWPSGSIEVQRSGFVETGRSKRPERT